jgi:glutaredoxin-related protein
MPKKKKAMPTLTRGICSICGDLRSLSTVVLDIHASGMAHEDFLCEDCIRETIKRYSDWLTYFSTDLK